VKTKTSKLAAHILAAVRGFARAKRGVLVLTGEDGTGKSHLAARILRGAGAGRMITHDDLLRALRATYRDDRAEDIVAACRKARLLVLDDFGLSGGKDEQSMLHAILDYRDGSGAPTVITSRLSLAEICASLGPRMADRLTQSLYAAVTLTGPSRRAAGRAA